MAKVSVVIPVYNAARTIERCLESLIEQSFEDYEIIIVDNGSEDGSFGLIEEFIRIHPKKKIKLIREEKKGPAPARNKGIKYAAGDIIAFTDSDCVADSKWLQEIVGAFDDESIGAVAGNIRGYKPSNLIEKFLCAFTLKGLEKGRDFVKYSILEGGFPTANLSVRKDLLEEIGNFQGKKSTEDHDVCAKLYSLGFKIRYITNGLIFHIHRDKLSGLISQSFGYGEGHAELLRKWRSHSLIIEFPKYTFQNSKFGFPIWANLNYADKKMVFFIILGFINPILFSLPVVYVVYISIDMKKKCKKQDIEVSAVEQIGLAFLLLIKSIAMTCGRIYGSFKSRVICI